MLRWKLVLADRRSQLQPTGSSAARAARRTSSEPPGLCPSPSRSTRHPRRLPSDPTEGAVYARNSTIAASYGCNDSTSGVDACSGTVPTGQPIDTSSEGPHTFTVTASDLAGNTNSRTVNYTVKAGPTAVRLLTFRRLAGRWTRVCAGVPDRRRACSDSPFTGRRAAGVCGVTPRLIAAKSRPVANVYTLVDRSRARRGARYLLQAVNVDGSRTSLGSTIVR